MKLSELKEAKDKKDEDSYQPPKIKVGDEVKVGRFKNRKAIVKSITKDKNNQPVLKTNKGDHKLFKPRITKIEDKDLKEGKAPTCNYCKDEATLKFIWADGRAYVPICDKHEAEARKEIETKNGDWAEIVGTKPI